MLDVQQAQGRWSGQERLLRHYDGERAIDDDGCDHVLGRPFPHAQLDARRARACLLSDLSELS
jgi:hypothetical protein